MGKIYCVMGKSSSGKDTVYKKLKEQYKEFRLIVPYTTRPIREGEKDGVEYYFVDPEQFRAMKEDGKVIESRSYNTKCGIWTYFTADDGQIDLSAAGLSFDRNARVISGFAGIFRRGGDRAGLSRSGRRTAACPRA